MNRPNTIYILILLWLALSGIFVLWGIYSLVIVIQIPLKNIGLSIGKDIGYRFPIHKKKKIKSKAITLETL